MTSPIPPEATGLWRRREISFPDGRRDTTTRVFWLQGPRLFADLRVPADRPNVADARGFADYSGTALLGLAAMQGFAGRFEIDGGTCRWLRELDYHPPGGLPDEALFRIEGDILVETGIHAAYEEIWQRETPLGAALAAFRPVEGKGLLVLAGDHFILVEERRAELPEAPSLAALIEADAGTPPAAERLGMLIAYGRIEQGWSVELSTFPWLEGKTWRASYDDGSGVLELTGPVVRQWRLVESSGELGVLISAH